MEITFINPVYLWFLISIPVMIIVHFISFKFTRRKALKFANYEAIEKITKKKILSRNYTALILRLLALAFLIFSITGVILWYYGQSSDFDFVLAIDASGSMLADDYSPNRLEAAKDAAALFIDYLPKNVRVGVVSFAGVAFVEQTPTPDMKKAKESIKNITIKLVGGTAIGGAIITSSNLLLTGEKTGVVVLLTDGQNNVGISPEEATKYADENGIIIHTIGIGTEEGGRFENLTFVSKLDVDALKKISNETGGDFYMAVNRKKLSEAYKKIASSTRQRMSIDLSPYFLLTVLLLLFIEWFLTNIKYRIIP